MIVLLYLVVYLVLGAFWGHLFIYSGRYKMKSTVGEEINEKWKRKKATIITFIWPYVVIKGLIQSR